MPRWWCLDPKVKDAFAREVDAMEDPRAIPAQLGAYRDELAARDAELMDRVKKAAR